MTLVRLDSVINDQDNYDQLPPIEVILGSFIEDTFIDIYIDGVKKETIGQLFDNDFYLRIAYFTNEAKPEEYVYVEDTMLIPAKSMTPDWRLAKTEENWEVETKQNVVLELKIGDGIIFQTVTRTNYDETRLFDIYACGSDFPIT